MARMITYLNHEQPMKSYYLTTERNGEIKVLDKATNNLIGKLCRGHRYGEWWVEPQNGKKEELINTKTNAIKYLLK